MSKITITIHTDNAAFNEEESGEYLEVVRILESLSRHIARSMSIDSKVTLLDVNGNKVGQFIYEED